MDYPTKNSTAITVPEFFFNEKDTIFEDNALFAEDYDIEEHYRHFMPLQQTSYDIFLKKYALRDRDGVLLEKTPEQMYRRVAKALASVEKSPLEWQKPFFDVMAYYGCIPAGRILANIGAEKHKKAVSAINCTVSAKIEDSMDSILHNVHKAGLTLKAGCGIGYEFSTLRPKGAKVAGAGAQTSGPLSFMDIFDAMCRTVSSAGGRRGAQMATFSVTHPDIFDFINVKQEDGRLRQFNLSCLISDAFMEALYKEEDIALTFLDEKTGEDVVYTVVKASLIWDAIMRSTYNHAEPGVLFIDNINHNNNNWFCEDIRATNPCGEQPLPPNGACLLGSINLTRFVKQPFTANAHFDLGRFCKAAAVFTRMLDNVVEVSNLPLQEQRDELLYKRRHGIGFMGVGSAINMLGYTYGDKKSLSFIETVTKQLALIGIEVGLELAKEKGCAPIFNDNTTLTERHMAYSDFLVFTKEVGDVVSNRELFLQSHYIQRLLCNREDQQAAIKEYGLRFTHHTSFAPTGTIALSLGNNVSNGIEPSFAHKYNRNVIREGRKTKEKVDVFSFELLAYRQLINPKADPYATEAEAALPGNFVDASAIPPKDHVEIQAAAQKWVDSSISKTINVPTDFPYDEFKDIYLLAYAKGLKGCTTFRFNPAAFQGVLVKNEDLAATTYRFVLADGSTLEVKGDEQIEYDGELHTAANLYDALKEGYYGKF